MMSRSVGKQWEEIGKKNGREEGREIKVRQGEKQRGGERKKAAERDRSERGNRIN